ncbi:MAG: 3-oxoacyl-ACP reductase FabG [Halothiobacillaceae bacterium]|jgi:3-oxoacyl-[acyl-carrier protein] reductase|nr:3-oxoacyl-ACP reductase FabG [Halothiobacillaceae bacterium]MDY0049722.1 3-oxoacyl-ACP reductase FabG [Halothiobacillaceae bacterium]
MKRALVTGGTGDIGAAVCRRLAARGLHVIVHTHSRPEQAQALVEDIRARGGSAQVVVFDVTEGETTRQALEVLLADGPIQVLVSNAGRHADAPLAGMSPRDWHEVIDVSLNGFYNVTQPLLLPMMGTRWGRVIALSSVAAIMGNRGQANYAAAKAGLHGAVRSLAIELASRGVTANAVAPGIIAGRMADAAFDEERIRQIVPMRRAGRPEEVAALVDFLASDEAGYISGQIISINGAMA